jgi:hypothetical protein
VFDAAYTRLFQDKAKAACRETVLTSSKKHHSTATRSRSKPWGTSQPIVFAEWSPVNGSMIKRRDFAFHELVSHASMRDLPLFSDQGEEVFIPEPVRDYPPVHFLELAHAYGD